MNDLESRIRAAFHGREDALKRMIQEAESLGANAVVNLRFATSSITQGAAELFAYGTGAAFGGVHLLHVPIHAERAR